MIALFPGRGKQSEKTPGPERPALRRGNNNIIILLPPRKPARGGEEREKSEGKDRPLDPAQPPVPEGRIYLLLLQSPLPPGREDLPLLRLPDEKDQVRPHWVDEIEDVDALLD